MFDVCLSEFSLRGLTVSVDLLHVLFGLEATEQMKRRWSSALLRSVLSHGEHPSLADSTSLMLAWAQPRSFSRAVGTCGLALGLMGSVGQSQ